MMLTLKGKADPNFIKDLRRDIHRFPELSGQEQRTAERVCHVLKGLGITDVRSNIAGYGIVAIVGKQTEGPVVALRADMDALPILEKTNVPFSSENAGVMHACGHDSHTAMLLGAAKILKEIEPQLPGRVVLIFQPAEEDAPFGGAQPMIDAGAFNEIKPDAVFGLHVWPQLPVGKIGVRPGYFMGASDRFQIHIKGHGGHASMPHETVDASIVAVQVVQTLQTIISRNLNPMDAGVVTIGKIQSGSRHNVIAEEAILEGTVRSFRQPVRHLISERVNQIVQDVARSMGAQAEITYQFGYPVLNNDASMVELVRDTAQELLGNQSLPEVEPVLVAEDFANYLQRFSGSFFWLGCGFEDESLNFPLHHPRFLVDERALPLGAEMLSGIALHFLGQKRVN